MQKPCVLREEKGKLFGFPCDFCKGTICSECTGALAGEIRIIPSVSRTTLYLCPCCKDKIKKLPEIQNQIHKTQQQGDETTKNLAKLKEEVESLKGSMERRRRENKSIKGEISTIKKEIKQVDQKIPEKQSYADALKKLEERVETIKKSPEGGEYDSAGVEITLFEMKERERRANNIIFFGIPESEKLDKHQDDKEKISSLFRKIDLTLPDTARIFRLGNEGPDKKRPVKVILPNREAALKALKKQKETRRESTRDLH